MITIEVVKARGGPRVRDNIDKTVQIGEIERLVSKGINKARAVLQDRRVVNITVDLADEFIKACPDRCNRNLLRVANDTIPLATIRAVNYRGRHHVQVILRNGKKDWVSRKYADALGITKYDYMEKGTKQPWSDRRVHDDIDPSEVVQVIRRGKRVARVLLVDGSQVLISRSMCNQIDESMGTNIGFLKPNTKKDSGFVMVIEDD